MSIPDFSEAELGAAGVLASVQADTPGDRLPQGQRSAVGHAGGDRRGGPATGADLAGVDVDTFPGLPPYVRGP